MEALLQMIWRDRLYTDLCLVDPEPSLPLEILDTGEQNSHAGPDFSGAKIRLDGLVWVGAVEIHERSSQWYEHGHDRDPAYEQVVLHISKHHDRPIYTSSGRQVPSATMLYAPDLEARASYLTTGARELACSPLSGRIPPKLIESELYHLWRERIYTKAQTLVGLWRELGDWYDTLYIGLMRSLGFGLHSDTMERLARSLPLVYLRKHRDRPELVEAMLFGQAGLIDSLPEGDYRHLLEREWQFLKAKYSLSPPQSLVWRRLRTRPAASPLRRLIQASTLLTSESLNIDQWLHAPTPKTLRELLHQSPPSNHWTETHLSADYTIRLSRSALDITLLNVALPLRLAWGIVYESEESTLQTCYELARVFASEDNSQIRLFAQAGIHPRHAADGQALIQRYRAYCTQHKCIYCPWGRYLLARTTP